MKIKRCAICTDNITNDNYKVFPLMFWDDSDRLACEDCAIQGDIIDCCRCGSLISIWISWNKGGQDYCEDCHDDQF
ncbi:hypothetical protein UFOVP9_25 [uncultured Caudovirales phage]|jgi:hypothetical protein|uniref:Uncharacterized protein n=1 Tax=uncultured Caudovirales phage TaxID=2100421 RepID=A0A6J5KJ85_9CAUD|nr:hypothetical protein UFOVP9_25 [uncultured Caudovirales phage]